MLKHGITSKFFYRNEIITDNKYPPVVFAKKALIKIN